MFRPRKPLTGAQPICRLSLDAERNTLAMIQVESLRKAYGVRVAVNEVSFSVKAGETFGLLGPNGAGKTTTIKMLIGQLTPTSGSARVSGCDVVSQRTDLHRHIGVVFEVQNLYQQMSARANLELFADIYRIPHSYVAELLDRVQLADRGSELVKKYSHGMKQRLLVARALLGRPRVLFLDEPTLGLDPASARELRSLFKELQDRGMTILLTTHYMEEADQVCDRVAIIDAGRIVALDSPHALKRTHAVPVLEIESNDGSRCVLDLSAPYTPARVTELVQSGKVDRIHTREPSLEDVFLSLTGKRLT